MIYDCFPFFNEFEMLSIRLNELKNVIDKHILVESEITHSGKSKELFFNERRALFRKWSDRIIHVNVRLFPGLPATVEQMQRQAIWDSLIKLNAKDDDVILMGDADEIPSPNAIKTALNYVDKGDVCFEMFLYQYYLNSCIGKEWPGTRMAKISTIRDNKWTMTELRHKSPSFLLKEAGWHFGFMGGADRVKKKIQSYMHSEYDLPQFTDIVEIEKRIKKGVDPYERNMPRENPAFIAPTSAMPITIQENGEFFAHMMKPPPTEKRH